MQRERDIEKYFKERVEAAGGEVRKVQWVGRAHAPDRVVFLHGCHWAEIKKPGETLRPGQEREHDRMRNHDVYPWVIDSYEQVDLFMDVLLHV